MSNSDSQSDTRDPENLVGLGSESTLRLTNISRQPRIRPVKSALPRFVMLVLVLAISGGHLTELFDRWDDTLRTGKDADYAIVLVCACAGAAVLAANSVRVLRRLVRTVVESAAYVCVQSSVIPAAALEPFPIDSSPPLTLAPIRI